MSRSAPIGLWMPKKPESRGREAVFRVMSLLRVGLDGDNRPIPNTNPIQKASLERKRLERHEKTLPTFGYALPSAFAAHATHRKQLIQF